MAEFVVGQKYVSSPEPELGLGTVVRVDGYQVGISFLASGENRIYAVDTTVLKRARFHEGETITTKDGRAFPVVRFDETDGLFIYFGANEEAREDQLSDVATFSGPIDRLFGGMGDSGDTFDLRYRTLRAKNRLLRSPWRGFMGGRVDLIPHQMYILHEVSARQSPRVLLSDEVGLGKTIEACLIIQRMRAIGRANRILILVPESLVHQWFVELLRRFNLWFSIYDEARCVAAENSSDGQNPFLDEQLVLCAVDFLASNEARGTQSIEAGWDMVVVDEAHHLEWTPESSSPEYALVERLGKISSGLLLLTATPTQLGLASHFARLRLLDPDRYGELQAFRKEADDYGAVASIAGKIADGTALDKSDREQLTRIFNKDLGGLKARLSDFESGKRNAKEALLKALLDEHGTGRVVFRNTRGQMKGFAKRMYCPAPLNAGGDSRTLMDRLVKEFDAEFRDEGAPIRYSFKGDPRLDWLVSFLKGKREAKALLICKTKRKALALEAALREKINVKVALFHEDLALVQRDRNAAWFSEPEGARLLICSEIGSEGRNFQFAHHLILFDLPSNPGLLEQRIGRLDRIGQTATIQIHVPYAVGSSQEYVADWYHQGLDAFETCVHGVSEYRKEFENRLYEKAMAYGADKKGPSRESLESFIEETIAFREKLDTALKEGRDRLLEMNSFDADVAADVVASIRDQEVKDAFRPIVLELMDHFGVRIDEHESGDLFLNARHAYVDSFPQIPEEGMLATFQRARAIEREDIDFVSQDHPLFGEVMGLLIDSDQGSSCFSIVESEESNALVEAIFVLEPVAQSSLHVERFMARTPLRAVVDISGNDISQKKDRAWMETQLKDGSLNRFLETRGLAREALVDMIDQAEEIVLEESSRLKREAKSRMTTVLGDELQRLRDLRMINSNVRLEEIELAKDEIVGLTACIDNARLRLDSIRLVVAGDVSHLAP